MAPTLEDSLGLFTINIFYYVWELESPSCHITGMSLLNFEKDEVFVLFCLIIKKVKDLF